jgi:hypothetical protein
MVAIAGKYPSLTFAVHRKLEIEIVTVVGEDLRRINIHP